MLAWPPPSAEAWEEAERLLVARIDPARLPAHVAVIMDGNGRWARSRGLLDRIRGHEAGIESVREITRTSAMLGLEALTLYAFSKENWQRPKRETGALMRLLERFAVEERGELMENDIQLLTIGNIADIPASVAAAIGETVRMTRNNGGTRLILALSYGGRDEIVRAARTLAEQVKAGRIEPGEINETSFAAALDTAGLPEPDLLIRTSGEMRISNFLVWQAAYAELVVTPTLWPDFRRRHLLEGLLEYQSRDRRFGRISDPDESGA